MYNKRTWALCPGAFDSFSKYQWAIGHYHLFFGPNFKIIKQTVCNKTALAWMFFFEKNKRTCSLIRESRVQLVKKGQNLSLFFLFLILLRSRRIWLRNHEKIECLTHSVLELVWIAVHNQNQRLPQHRSQNKQEFEILQGRPFFTNWYKIGFWKI